MKFAALVQSHDDTSFLDGNYERADKISEINVLRSGNRRGFAAITVRDQFLSSVNYAGKEYTYRRERTSFKCNSISNVFLTLLHPYKSHDKKRPRSGPGRSKEEPNAPAIHGIKP